jgi:hypothetical protein
VIHTRASPTTRCSVSARGTATRVAVRPVVRVPWVASPHPTTLGTGPLPSAAWCVHWAVLVFTRGLLHNARDTVDWETLAALAISLMDTPVYPLPKTLPSLHRYVAILAQNGTAVKPVAAQTRPASAANVA